MIDVPSKMLYVVIFFEHPSLASVSCASSSFSHLTVMSVASRISKEFSSKQDTPTCFQTSPSWEAPREERQEIRGWAMRCGHNRRAHMLQNLASAPDSAVFFLLMRNSLRLKANNSDQREPTRQDEDNELTASWEAPNRKLASLPSIPVGSILGAAGGAFAIANRWAKKVTTCQDRDLHT